jgi:hypothetical protein
MKVKTTVKAGAVVVGVGNIIGSNGTGNSAATGSNIGANIQTGSGIQVNVL